MWIRVYINLIHLILQRGVDLELLNIGLFRKITSILVNLIVARNSVFFWGKFLLLNIELSKEKFSVPMGG